VNDAGEQLRALAEPYYKVWFRFHPQAAVDAGVAGYAHRLPPCDEEARGALVCLNDELRAGIDEIDRTGLGVDAAIDAELMYGAAQLENQRLLNVELARPDPEHWLPIDAVYQLTIRPVEDFPGALLSRLRAIPAFLADVREFLARRAAAVPVVWLESAVAAARGGIEFFRSLPVHPKVGEAGIAGLETALHQAMQALEQHANFLEVDLAPRAQGDVACGPDYFGLLLRRRHFLDVTADEVFRFGEELVSRTQAELNVVCRRLTGREDMGAVLQRLRAHHPHRNELLNVYAAQMRAAREHVVAKALVTIPAVESLDVVETPAFLRHQIPFAAYSEPAPNDPAQRGHYYVTVPDDDEALAEHDFAGLEHTCVHEAWPGHHLQFVTANANPSSRTLPRLLNTSATLYEGWALYSEQLMREQGFLAKPEQEFILLRDRLWRALRIVIDVGIHTREESLEHAAQRLVQHLGFPPAQAMAEVTWYSRAPTVPLGYATGWALINALRDAVKLSPREFHDRLLSAGSIALPLVIRRAFGPDAWAGVKRSVFGNIEMKA
jgi:uncharacterized protein (DUF885 family)